MHPNLPIIASVGEDMNLMIWDCENNILLKKTQLPMLPTAIKFSSGGSSGEYLAIGYYTGLLTFFDSRISKNQG